MSHTEESFDRALFDSISAYPMVGYLGIMTPDQYPRVVPVNFVTIGDRVYFHGAQSGEKHDAFARGQKVTFCIAIPYAVIPSYWRSTDYACPATQFFKSILIRGHGVIVHDPDEKAAALQALMEKHQPDIGFRPIDASDPLYAKALDEVAVFRIDPERIDIRSKFGENLSRETRLVLIEKLKERNEGLDPETAMEMEKRLMLQSSPEEGK